LNDWGIRLLPIPFKKRDPEQAREGEKCLREREIVNQKKETVKLCSGRRGDRRGGLARSGGGRGRKGGSKSSCWRGTGHCAF